MQPVLDDRESDSPQRSGYIRLAAGSGRSNRPRGDLPRKDKALSDRTTTVGELIELVRAFSRERDWERFHHPKDLGLALAIEVGELLEHFRYRTNVEIERHLADADQKREVSHEIADCVWLLLRMADVCSFDLSDALKEKLTLAALKYPADQVRGKPDKYTAYQKAPHSVDRSGDGPRETGE